MKPVTLAFAAMIAFTTAAPAATATDYTALREDSFIHDRLLIAAKAWYLAKNCPSLKPNKFAALPHMIKMRSRASRLGYSVSEMSDYVDNKQEQDRFRQVVVPWAQDLGAVPGQPDTFCAVAKGQMKEKTFVGQLLKAR